MNAARLRRLRHIARRVVEVSPAFLLQKLALECRKKYMWFFYAAGARWSAFRRPRPLGKHFDATARDLRASISRGVRLGPDESDALFEVLERGRFATLGFGNLPIPRGRDWHLDSVSGYRWPLTYFTRIDFLTHGQNADVKVCWELSRFQWAVILAFAAVADEHEDRRKRARDCFLEIFDDWCRWNPPGFGVNWTVGMEVAIRAINLSLAAMILWPELPDTTRRQVHRSLSDHYGYLRRFPERSDIDGNHQLLCICGIMVLEGVVLEGREEFRRSAQKRLQSVEAQFSTDGLHIEHAPMYHRLCTEALGWCLAAAERSGTIDCTPLVALVQRAVSCLAHLTSPDDKLPVIGDSDAGQVVSLGKASRSTAYLRQIVGHDSRGPALMQAVGGGSAVPAAFSTLSRVERSAFAVKLAPYIILRSADGTKMVVRGGAHGLSGRASHDHDDNGSPWLSVDGADLFVDRGCYAYTRDRARRDVDLSSAAHNLLLVGSANRFRGRHGAISTVVPDAPVPGAVAIRDGLESTDCELHLDWEDTRCGWVRHTRTITVADRCTDAAGLFLCVDRARVDRAADLTVRWHVAPGWRVTPFGTEGVAMDRIGGDRRLLMKFDSDVGGLSLSVAPTDFAGLYGGLEAATVVTLTASGSTSWQLTTRVFRYSREVSAR